MYIRESHICSSVRTQRSGPWSTVGVGFLGFPLHCLKLYSWGFTFRIAACARVCACYVYMCIYVNIYEHVHSCLYSWCTSMYVCEYSYVCLWIWYMSICIYVNICIHRYIIYACIYIHMHICENLCVYMSSAWCVHVYMHMCMYICECTYNLCMHTSVYNVYMNICV